MPDCSLQTVDQNVHRLRDKSRLQTIYNCVISANISGVLWLIAVKVCGLVSLNITPFSLNTTQVCLNDTPVSLFTASSQMVTQLG